jgi:hypothetical protein
MEPGDRSQTGRWPPRVRTVVDLAIAEARALNHDWVGQDHLLLALLRPDCPGAAPAVLRSLGATPALRAVLTANMGEPFEPGGAGITLTPATRLLLQRASLEASGLGAAEVSSEHVLLALTRRWDGAVLTNWLWRRGVDAETVRRRVVDVTQGVAVPQATPLPPDPLPSETDPTLGLELRPTPDGKDPRQRGPWGSMPFVDDLGRTFRRGRELRQYLIDRDGNPVLTADGQPIGLLVDEQGELTRDAQGRPIGPVEIPPGCQVRRASS